MTVVWVDLAVYKEGDNKRGHTACNHHPEEVDVANGFLYVSSKHAWYHHAQCHESGANSVVRCLKLALREIYHIEHIGRETKAVAKLLNSNSNTDIYNILGLPNG